MAQQVKNPPVSTADTRDVGLVPESVQCPGKGNPLQYSCLKNPMDRGAWWATVQRVAKSQTQLNNYAESFLYARYCSKGFTLLIYLIQIINHQGNVNQNYRIPVGMSIINQKEIGKLSKQREVLCKWPVVGQVSLCTKNRKGLVGLECRDMEESAEHGSWRVKVGTAHVELCKLWWGALFSLGF